MLDVNPDIAEMHQFIETATKALESQENKRFLNRTEFLKIGVFLDVGVCLKILIWAVEMAIKKAEKGPMNETSDFTFIFDYFERNSDDEIDRKSLLRSITNFGLETNFGKETLKEMMKWTTKQSLNRREFNRLLTTTIVFV